MHAKRRHGGVPPSHSHKTKNNSLFYMHKLNSHKDL